MSLDELSFWVWVAYVLAVCGAAFWIGGLTERLGAAAILLGWIATAVISSIVRVAYGGEVAVVDILLLFALVALALRSRRYWPLWAAGFHLLAVVTHWIVVLDRTVNRWTYVTAGIIWGYLLVGALAYGTWGAWRQRRQLARAGAPVAEPGATRL